MHRSAARRLLAATALGLALAAPASASAFDLGFNDEELGAYAGVGGWQKPELAKLDAGLLNGQQAGAKTWRLMIRWNYVARPSGATAPNPATLAADPAWPGYDWTAYDNYLRSIAAHGMTPILWIAKAPTWAEGANRPPTSQTVPAGTWKPDPAALRQFAQALARRYDGTYPDPANPGRALPRVGTFMGWNEPNLYSDLTPQWEKAGGRYRIASVSRYRDLQNSAYLGVKAAQPTAVVLSAGSAPFGGLSPADPRIQPARFWRELLCVKKSSKGKLTGSKKCPKLRIDGWAHQPYPIGPPTRTARNADDVTVPDLEKLTAIIAAARKAKTVSASAAKNVWITELSWESQPDPNGLSLEAHAQYMAGAFYQLWKDGAKHVIWWNMRDNPKGTDWNVSLQSGIFLRGAEPAADVRKPSWTAFHFPFTAYRSRGTATLWTLPPVAGDVTVEAQTTTGWKPVATLKRKSDGTAWKTLRVGPRVTLRARVADQTSLTWKTR
ncbi:MAG: hypothetical protein J7513_00400 [Solirubrobacteraceae bacterium]|nr:hypothetical protein [Solirubrobacteraceae bacterium]